jgi:hypothetical protein
MTCSHLVLSPLVYIPRFTDTKYDAVGRVVPNCVLGSVDAGFDHHDVAGSAMEDGCTSILRYIWGVSKARPWSVPTLNPHVERLSHWLRQ